MSRSIIHNLPRNFLSPRGELAISIAQDGLIRASADFSCLSTDLESPQIQAKLEAGTPIAELYPEIGMTFSVMSVEGYTSSAKPGGYTVVSVNFVGAAIVTNEFASADVNYTRNSSLREESIFNHPTFIKEVVEYTRETIRLATLGLVFSTDPDPANLYYIRYAANQQLRDHITDPKFIAWWKFIVTEKNLTYHFPQSEWTLSATGKSKLRDSDLSKLGLIDTPDGDPSAPAGDNWMLTGITENIQASGEGINSFSKTWTSGVWPAMVYTIT